MFLIYMYHVPYLETEYSIYIYVIAFKLLFTLIIAPIKQQFSNFSPNLPSPRGEHLSVLKESLGCLHRVIDRRPWRPLIAS